MRKRLLAMLIALVMVASLLPVAALAAGNTVQSSNGYVSVSYENDGAFERSITVNIYGSDGTLVDTAKIDDAIYGVQSVTITLNSNYASQFDIESVDVSGGSDTSMSISADTCSFDLAAIDGDDGATVSVYLCEEYVAPALPDGLIDNISLTRSYRIYDDQILKLLHDAGVSVSETTEIKSVQPAWVKSFAEDYRGFDRIDREEDYWHLTVTSSNANVETVQPNNIRKITITYDNGNGEQSVNVYSGDLRYHIDSEASSRYYRIELNDDSFHIVCFYNEPGSQAGNNYFLYAVRFVEHGASLGSDMPPQPDYGTGNTYMFVNWEQGSYDGTGDPFLSTTVVNEDLTVFAKKVSSPDDGGTEIWVMNYEDDQLLKRVAELYNETYSSSIDVADIDLDSVKISVYDNSKNTNKDYYSNGWRNDEEYYYVCNYNVPAGLPTLTNNHVAFNDIQGITVFFSLVNSGIVQEVRIPVGENPGDIAKSHSAVDNIIELRIIQPSGGPGGDDDKVVYTVNYYYDGVPDASKTVTGTGTVGDTITSVPDKSGTGYKLYHDNLPFVLMEDSADNVINVYYEKDESQTKELTYTVQHVDKDTNEILASENITVNIWVGDNTYTVTSLNAKTFEGYTFSGETEPPMNVTVHAGDIIKVFYIKDPEPREYAVNYHIVDANGNVMTDLDYTVYLTEDEFEGYKIWQPDGQAGCTFSGWFQKVSDLEANHAQVTELYTAKKWELYGRFTPNVPTDTWLQSNVKIQVDCQTLSESVHKNMDTMLIAGSYSSGTLHANADGSWGYSFTVYVDSYLKKYNSTYGEHTANDSAKTVNLTFRNGEWQNSDAENNIYAVFDVKCVVPTAPTAEQAAEFFKVKLDCLTSNNWGDYQHNSKQYDTTAASVTVGTVVYENGAWTCPVTIDSASYVAKYSEEFGEHTNSGSATQVKKLVYEGDSWKRVGDDVVAFDVKCTEPEIPTVDDIVDMFSGKGAVKVECITEGIQHNSKGYELVAEGLTIGNPEKRDNKLVLPITIKIDPYLKQYEDVYGDHTGEGTTKTTYKVFWDGTKWTFDKEKLPLVVFDVKCATPAAPNAPTEDELKALFDGKVFVDCVEKSWHPTYGYGLLTNGYTLTGPVKGADGEYTCTVTLLASAYLAEYNDDVTEKHALASYQGSETVSLKWTGSAWTVINGELPVTFDVVCDTWYPPIIPPVTPSEPVYTPNWLNTTDHVSYIIGYSDGTVKPNAGITRAEVATIFFRLLTDGARERFWSETSAYSDVAAGSWYNIAVSTLSNMGILGGYEDGTFRPNASITRAEFAKIAVSFFDWADVYAVNSFVDVRDSAWYANYVAVAAEIGLIEGYGGNVFRPDATITRAEACTIINRTLGRAPDADHLLPVAQMNTWPDNSDTGVWYYAQIQEATNSHDYRWLGDIEQWTAKLADPDWDKLQY